MVFTYKLNGTGWAEGQLKINKQILEFEVSYLCDPLSDLLESLVAITPGYAKRDMDSTNDDNEKTFIWVGEPWAYKWFIKFNSFDSLQIQISYIEDYIGEVGNEEICFDTTCKYFDFANAVIDELSLLLKKHGFVGYYETWASNINFPLTDFIKLKHYIKTKAAMETEPIKPKNSVCAGNWTQATSLEYELKFLTEDL